MSEKPIFEISTISSGSEFESFIKEIHISELPANYVEKIMVTFKDGSIIMVPGREITEPIHVDKPFNIPAYKLEHSKVEHIRVYINVRQLEMDINFLVNTIIDDTI